MRSLRALVKRGFAGRRAGRALRGSRCRPNRDRARAFQVAAVTPTTTSILVGNFPRRQRRAGRSRNFGAVSVLRERSVLTKIFDDQRLIPARDRRLATALLLDPIRRFSGLGMLNER